jgi:hypothetical protein
MPDHQPGDHAVLLARPQHGASAALTRGAAARALRIPLLLMGADRRVAGLTIAKFGPFPTPDKCHMIPATQQTFYTHNAISASPAVDCARHRFHECSMRN